MRIIAIAGWLLAATSLAQAAAVATGIESPASAPEASATPAPVAGTDTIVVTDADDAANKIGFSTAISLIKEGQPQLAAAMLDKLIPRLEKRYAKPAGQLYCSHTQAEGVAYMSLAVAARRNALAVDSDLCDAYFFRGYANVDLGNPAAAEADFTRALELSPNNPHYLSEMGELLSHQHDLERALGYYERARDASPVYAREDMQVAELTRALRGIGFVDVELGRLDDAEAQYRRCLELDANDQKARAELGYVLNLRAKQVGPGN